jgi:hypothetical protein
MAKKVLVRWDGTITKQVLALYDLTGCPDYRAIPCPAS